MFHMFYAHPVELKTVYEGILNDKNIIQFSENKI